MTFNSHLRFHTLLLHDSSAASLVFHHNRSDASQIQPYFLCNLVTSIGINCSLIFTYCNQYLQKRQQINYACYENYFIVFENPQSPDTLVLFQSIKYFSIKFFRNVNISFTFLVHNFLHFRQEAKTDKVVEKQKKVFNDLKKEKYVKILKYQKEFSNFHGIYDTLVFTASTNDSNDELKMKEQVIIQTSNLYNNLQCI